MLRLKNEDDLRELRVSGTILAKILGTLKSEVRVGLPLTHFDERARELLEKYGAISPFLNYRAHKNESPYPATVCTSVNDTIVHGLPNSYLLREGDVLKIDCGVSYKKYITDAALTIPVGTVSKQVKHLIQKTQEALQEGIQVCAPGHTIGDIGHAIGTVAKKAGLHVVKGLSGHGVGFELHEDPQVYNYGKEGEGMPLETGMVLAIEPMFAIGTSQTAYEKDGSFRTKDGSLSAHFERTVAITKEGCEVLTPW